MGTVVALTTQTDVDQAWETLCEHRKALVNNPGLMLDREYVQTDIRLHRRFAKLFLLQVGEP